MATAVLAGFWGLYGDKVYSATDLNRRAGKVLNQARLCPVTISRKNEQFALLRREDVGNLVKALTQLQNSIELTRAALRRSEGGEVPPSLSWLKAFKQEDLGTMCDEVLTASENAMYDGDWKKVADLIHEWRETAAVASSGVLDEAINSEADEVELPNPQQVLEETGPAIAAASQ